MKSERLPQEAVLGCAAIFVHSAIRECRLTPYEALTLLHVASRDGAAGCFQPVAGIADETGMNSKTVRACLHALVAAGILTAKKTNRATVYRRASAEIIGRQHSRGAVGQARPKTSTPVGRESPPPTGREGQHSRGAVAKSNPIEGNPMKGKCCNGSAVAPPRHLLLELWRVATPDGKRVIERLRKLVPDAHQNGGHWKAQLEADATLLAEGLERLWARMQSDTLHPVENPGAWLTDWIKHENGEHENQY
jgi:hypothetical protein